MGPNALGGVSPHSSHAQVHSEWPYITRSCRNEGRQAESTP